MPPIADAVMALHLVADGGKHYWIEPESLTQLGARLTDDEPLLSLYGQPQFGGRNHFEIIRDDNLFNSVLVSVGRFGIVYSIVLAAVGQYSLHQERRLTTWQEIKTQIADQTSALYTGNDQPQSPPSPNKFLQVAVSQGVSPLFNDGAVGSAQVRKAERVGKIAAGAVVQLLFSTGKSFTVDGLREKLRQFYLKEARPEFHAVASLNNVELIAALLSCNWQLALVGPSASRHRRPNSECRCCAMSGSHLDDGFPRLLS